MSAISTTRGRLPACTTSCSKLSSNTRHLPSSQLLHSPPTRILGLTPGEGGTSSPKWMRIRVFVGPQWGLITVPPASLEKMREPRTCVAISGQRSNISFRVSGQRAQFTGCFLPFSISLKSVHSPSSTSGLSVIGVHLLVSAAERSERYSRRMAGKASSSSRAAGTSATSQKALAVSPGTYRSFGLCSGWLQTPLSTAMACTASASRGRPAARRHSAQRK
mmetsp:Transcript_29590/g.52992  ORF Transcript_29590/g.52992 Transcript_29590/m.52992 type:complete len:220 (-) Transcript_29590:341-1000(-)